MNILRFPRIIFQIHREMIFEYFLFIFISLLLLPLHSPKCENLRRRDIASLRIQFWTTFPFFMRRIIFSEKKFFHFAGDRECCNLRNFFSKGMRWDVCIPTRRVDLFARKIFLTFSQSSRVMLLVNKRERSLSNWQIHNWKAGARWNISALERRFAFLLFVDLRVRRRYSWWDDSKHFWWRASRRTKIYWRKAFRMPAAMITVWAVSNILWVELFLIFSWNIFLAVFEFSAFLFLALK